MLCLGVYITIKTKLFSIDGFAGGFVVLVLGGLVLGELDMYFWVVSILLYFDGAIKWVPWSVFGI